MSARPPEVRRRGFRWLVPGALLALAPKCVLCVAGYLGLGTTLGWTSAELCGGPEPTTAPHLWLGAGFAALTLGARLVQSRRGCARSAWRRRRGPAGRPVAALTQGPVAKPSGTAGS